MGFKRNKASEVLDEIIETVKEVFPEAEVKEILPPEEPEILADTEVLSEKEILAIVPKSELKKVQRKKIKKRNYTKVKVDCGLKGTTIETRDFRAIVKKKGLQVNVVLNGIIAEWNHANYNL